MHINYLWGCLSTDIHLRKKCLNRSSRQSGSAFLRPHVYGRLLVLYDPLTKEKHGKPFIGLKAWGYSYENKTSMVAACSQRLSVNTANERRPT